MYFLILLNDFVLFRLTGENCNSKSSYDVEDASDEGSASSPSAYNNTSRRSPDDYEGKRRSFTQIRPLHRHDCLLKRCFLDIRRSSTPEGYNDSRHNPSDASFGSHSPNMQKSFSEDEQRPHWFPGSRVSTDQQETSDGVASSCEAPISASNVLFNIAMARQLKGRVDIPEGHVYGDLASTVGGKRLGPYQDVCESPKNDHSPVTSAVVSSLQMKA